MMGKGLGVFSADLAGCVPVFPASVGETLAHSTELDSLRRRQILFGRIDQPGRIHVYSAECVAGERLRVQLLAPKLPFGRGLAPSFAVIAQSLPYSADIQKLPIGLPAGYSAVVAPAPGQLAAPVRDPLTRTEYFSGPLVDTRTLVGGRCYIVVWSPTEQIGKYALRIGSSWPWRFGYWLRLPFFWWQIRGWFGVSRARAWVALAMLLGVLLAIVRMLKEDETRRDSAQDNGGGVSGDGRGVSPGGTAPQTDPATDGMPGDEPASELGEQTADKPVDNRC